MQCNSLYFVIEKNLETIRSLKIFQLDNITRDFDKSNVIHGLHKYRFCGERTINRTKRSLCVQV